MLEYRSVIVLSGGYCKTAIQATMIVTQTYPGLSFASWGREGSASALPFVLPRNACPLPLYELRWGVKVDLVGGLSLVIYFEYLEQVNGNVKLFKRDQSVKRLGVCLYIV